MKKLMPLFFLVFTFLLHSPNVKAETIPTISALTPDYAEVGSEAFDVTIEGSNFNNGTGMKVFFNGTEKAINLATDLKIIFTVNAEEVASMGIRPIKVFWKNAAGDYIRISSDDFALKVIERLPGTSASPADVEILDVGPRSIAQGSDTFRLKITGHHLNAFPAEIGFDGIRVDIVESNPNELFAKIPADLLREAKTLTVKVAVYTSTDHPLIKTFEFKITAPEETSHVDANGINTENRNPGIEGQASGAGCSMLSGSVLGNSWFMILGFIFQISMFLNLRKQK